MSTLRRGRYALMAAPVIGLVACSSSDTTQSLTGPFDDNGLPFAQDGLILNVTLTPAIADRPFTANTADAEWTTTGNTSTSGTASFTIVSTTVIEMTRGGDTWTFRNQGPSASDPDVDLWLADESAGDGPTTLEAIFGQGAAESATTIETELQSIFFGEIKTPPPLATGVTDFSSDTFAISGFETIPTEIEALDAAANYQGEAQLVGRSSVTDAAAGKLLDGTFDITIDYAGGNTVSGTLTGGSDAEFGGGSLELTLGAGGAVAAGENTFATTFSKTGGTNTDITGFSDTSLRGTLYGQDAKEIGLLMSGDATITGTGTIPTTGFGQGSKQ